MLFYFRIHDEPEASNGKQSLAKKIVVEPEEFANTR